MKKVFIVICNAAVSQEGYGNINQAIEFITSRADRPKQVIGWTYVSDTNIYTIKEITIKGE